MRFLSKLTTYTIKKLFLINTRFYTILRPGISNSHHCLYQFSPPRMSLPRTTIPWDNLATRRN